MHTLSLIEKLGLQSLALLTGMAALSLIPLVAVTLT